MNGEWQRGSSPTHFSRGANGFPLKLILRRVKFLSTFRCIINWTFLSMLGELVLPLIPNISSVYLVRNCHFTYIICMDSQALCFSLPHLTE